MKRPTSCLLTCLLPVLLLVGCASHTPSTLPVLRQPAPAPLSPDASAPPPATPVVTNPRDRAQHCVALAMYWEARGEGQLGMTAVGAVINNRVASDQFPDDHCGVVHQGGETPPCQFSWWCDGKSDRPRDQRQWMLALATAEAALVQPVADPTDGALFFHSAAIDRPWQRTRTTRIGGHIFYR